MVRGKVASSDLMSETKHSIQLLSNPSVPQPISNISPWKSELDGIFEFATVGGLAEAVLVLPVSKGPRQLPVTEPATLVAVVVLGDPQFL